VSGVVRLVNGQRLGQGPFGFTLAQVRELTGLTTRIVDYRARVGHLTPSILTGRGPGNRRCWSSQDIVALRVLALLDVDDTDYYLRNTDQVVTVIGLDQCLTVLFPRAGSA
jgi:hypothetical protein